MEKKDIKDYLHLYVGCECETDSGIQGKLITINSEAGIAVIRISEGLGQTVSKLYSEVTPILRPLSSMTEEEKQTVLSIMWSNKESRFTMDEIDALLRPPHHWSSEALLYLLSIGVDIFDLIPEGLAIDSTLKPV